MAATPLLLTQSIDTHQPFRALFDRMPFLFSQTLHQSPWFSDKALDELVERAARKPNGFYVEDGETTPGAGWSKHAGGTPVTEVWADLSRRKSLILLKGLQLEPGYSAIYEGIIEDLTALTGIDIRAHYGDGRMTIILTSPNRVTPYHIDENANLLMQIRGSKTVYIFDGNDREILPAEELERFWSGDIYAARYREQFQSRSWSFALEPGVGVTNPITFPHWVKNGPDVSVSVSVNFKRTVNESANVHRINDRFRRLGLHPSNPGSHPLVDQTKSNLYHAAYTLKKKIAGLRHSPR